MSLRSRPPNRRFLVLAVASCALAACTDDVLETRIEPGEEDAFTLYARVWDEELIDDLGWSITDYALDRGHRSFVVCRGVVDETLEAPPGQLWLRAQGVFLSYGAPCGSNYTYTLMDAENRVYGRTIVRPAEPR